MILPKKLISLKLQFLLNFLPFGFFVVYMQAFVNFRRLGKGRLAATLTAYGLLILSFVVFLCAWLCAVKTQFLWTGLSAANIVFFCLSYFYAAAVVAGLAELSAEAILIKYFLKKLAEKTENNFL